MKEVNEMGFEELVKMLPVIEHYKSKYINYFNLLDCIVSGEFDTCADLFAIPFYLTDKGIYELYEYELMIRNEAEFDVENYILTKTGRASIDTVPDDILKRFYVCKIDMKKMKTGALKRALLNYLKELSIDAEMHDRMISVFGTFDIQNIWFEFYF